MYVVMRLTGRTGLAMHNPRLVDKTDPITREIGELTKVAVNKRTDAQNTQIEHLEFLGGLYYDPAVGVYVPAFAVVRTFESAGRITKQGTDIVRALALVSDKVPLRYEGPRDPEGLWARPEFRWRQTVVVARRRVMRMRPIFRQWALDFEAELLDDVLNPGDLAAIAEKAGQAVGLLEGRKLGNGRFSVEVVTESGERRK